MINFLHIRYYHWIFISLLLREYFKEKGEVLIIVCPRSCKDFMLELGLDHKIDFIFEGEFQNKVDSIDTAINIIIHHGEASISNFSQKYFNALEEKIGVNVSFYADGFTNKLLREDLSEELIRSFVNLKLNSVYTFDLEVLTNSKLLLSASNEVVQSSLVTKIMESKLLQEKVSPIINAIAKDVVTAEACLIALRPWGSESFQSGAFYFQDSENTFSEILLSYIKCVEETLGSNDTTFIIRPDSRDLSYTSRVGNNVKEGVGNNVILLGDDWPSWMTIDYFILYFQALTGKKLSIVTFDSTAGLPYFNSSYMHKQFSGVPDLCLEKIPESKFKKLLCKKSKSILNNIKRTEQDRKDVRVEYLNEYFAIIDQAPGLHDYVPVAREVLKIEADSIKHVSQKLGMSFNSIVDCIVQSKGRVVLCGMGKSGHIAKKIFATLISTGTPSLFLHPAEALHGDLGMVLPDDIFILMSNSGETEELIRLIPFISDNGNLLLSMTGNPLSTLALSSDYHIDIGVNQEACPLQLAPTSSTTVTLAVGDAIAVSLMEARNFKPENFAKFHPGGALGKKLLGVVGNYTNPSIEISSNTEFKDILSAISNANSGLICIVDNHSLVGVITDGDLRRQFSTVDIQELVKLTALDIMSSNPRTVCFDTRCSDADRIMAEESVNSLIVKTHSGNFEIYNNLNR